MIGKIFIIWLLNSPLKPNLKPLSLSLTSHDFDIISYDLNLWVDVYAETLKGYNEIKFMSLKNGLDSIFLHFTDSLNVDSIVNSRSFIHTSGNLLIYLNTPLDSGAIDSVKIFYKGTPSTEGGVGFFFYPSSNLAYSFTEPDGARNWFPCFDEPAEKAKISFHIKVLDTFVVAGNGVLDSVQYKGDTAIYHWRTNYGISTYLMAISIHPYAILSDTWQLMPIMNFVYPADTSDAEIVFQNTPEMLSFLSDKFGEYPFVSEKYGHAEVLAYGWGAMEHATITFIHQYFVQNPSFYSEMVVLHELAHHWFGNSVTCEDWTDIWLNEGFASYCEALWREYKSGYPAYMNYIHNFQNNVLSSSLEWTSPIYDPNPLFSVITYDKAACVLHMLRFLINDDTLFFNSLKDYHLTFKYDNATTEELKNFLIQRTGIDLNKFFDQWIYKVGHPQIEWSYKILNDTVLVEIWQVQDTSLYNTSIFEFPLEIGILRQAGDTVFVRVIDSLQYQKFRIYPGFVAQDVYLDPHRNILMEKTLLAEEKFSYKEKQDIKLVIKNGKYFVKSPDKKNYKITLYDVNGRKIFEKEKCGIFKINLKKSGNFIILLQRNKKKKYFKIWNIR